MDTLKKFQDLLEKLFQFEAADLDFGLYRILNSKKDRLEKFIRVDLKNRVEAAFAKHKEERLADIEQRFNEVTQKVGQGLGTQALSLAGELNEKFKDTPLGREYLAVKEQKVEAQKIDEIKDQVFNDLFNFFGRFYTEGDFIPQYRYSIKGHKYAIPYNGEEVKLYWANKDQYYVKTGLLFRDYTFFTGPGKTYKIIFRLVSAQEELGSNKATKERFFVLDKEKPTEYILSCLAADTEPIKTIIVRFCYRELTAEEVKHYRVEGGSNTAKQEKINQKTFAEVLSQIDDLILKGFLTKEYKNEKPLLFYQISRFAAKNTKDYFIHKNLKKFLSEQLDYFIKAEVLSIKTLEQERFLDKHLTRARVVSEIGEDIIDFLAQIEDFQKKLWEKKKFVLKTEYVITCDQVPEEFYQEILQNEEQKREWVEMGFGEIKDINDLIKDGKSTVPVDKKNYPPAELRVVGAKNFSPPLPVDTRYFSPEFKEKLLEALSEKGALDDRLNGILVKSENWQALNLLLGKYREKIQTIYIDPPFNLGVGADFLYNVNYKDSTWISILENRLWLAKNLMSEKGSIFVRCDYNGNMYVRLLMNEIFGGDNFLHQIIINRRKFQMLGGKTFSTRTENLLFFSKTSNLLFNKIRRKIKNPEWRPLLHLPGTRERSERHIEGRKIIPPKGRHFGISQQALDIAYSEGRVRFNDKGQAEIFVDTEELNDNWTDIEGYSFGWEFSTENAEVLLKRCIETTSNKGNIILDFFLGSGTTTAVAHKLGRKWLGIEMGEHFWTVVLPRMKKVLAYDKSGISKEKDVKEKYNEKTAGGFFKYHVLEQYEDTLDNIAGTLNLTPLQYKQAQLKFGDDYLLKYFLDYETRKNPYLLNMDMLKNPFSYKLKVNLEEIGEPEEMVVDIPETFNYLLGLKVKKIKARNEDKKYLFVLGEKEGKDIAVVWREYQDSWSENDFKQDKEFVIKELEGWEAHIIYVNGQSILTPKLGKQQVEIRYIEPEFKRLMLYKEGSR